MGLNIIIKILCIFAITILLVEEGFVLIQMFFAETGIFQPSAYYQRFRYDEFSSKDPFFQWWYFSIKDYESNSAFAMTYAINRASKGASFTGSYIMFTKISPFEKFHIYYKMSLEDLKAVDETNIQIHNNKFSIEVLENGERAGGEYRM